MSDIRDYDEEADDDVEVLVCECCIMLICNDDDSACRGYHHHDHPDCQLPAYTVVFTDTIDDWDSTWPGECAGCGQTLLQGATYALAEHERNLV